MPRGRCWTVRPIITKYTYLYVGEEKGILLFEFAIQSNGRPMQANTKVAEETGPPGGRGLRANEIRANVENLINRTKGQPD